MFWSVVVIVVVSCLYNDATPVAIVLLCCCIWSIFSCSYILVVAFVVFQVVVLVSDCGCVVLL